jgi:hypothetical protein
LSSRQVREDLNSKFDIVSFGNAAIERSRDDVDLNRRVSAMRRPSLESLVRKLRKKSSTDLGASRG